MSNNIGENICESIKIVGESLLQGLAYDQTIECTIIDASKKNSGVYRVSNGATSFLAYSNETYEENVSVYVTIPGGDYNNQKLIIGRKINSENDSYKYRLPFETYVDVTSNLVAAAGSPVGLTANKDSIYKEKIISDGEVIEQEFNDGQIIEIIPYTKVADSNGTGFSRLGLKASFQSLLENYNCIYGDYGLWIRITIENNNVNLTDNNEVDNKQTYQKDLYLDINDMIGNPYQFTGFYPQEKVFNISTLGKIIGIQGWFYQDHNFIDNKNNPIPSRNEELDTWYPNNLFIKDWYVSLGYDISEMDNDLVQIYTNDTLTYKPIKAIEAELNNINLKELNLRWLHYDKVNNKIYEIKQGSTEPFSIRWYRYKRGAPSPDEYVWTNWELATSDGNLSVDANTNFKAWLNPNTAEEIEQIKAVVIYGQAFYEAVNNLKEEEYNPRHYYIKDDVTGEYRQCTHKDVYDAGETYYILTEDTRQEYYSNILTFDNQEELPNNATINVLQALNLICYDIRDDVYKLTQGNYLLYDEGHNLREDSEAKVPRQIRAILSLDDGEKNLAQADKIIWRFPATSTMIKIDADFAEIIGFNSEPVDDVYTITIDKDMIHNNKDIYFFKEIYPIFNYNIARQFSYSNTNNWIECTVIYENTAYTMVKDLTFGIAGTMGTEYTFILDYVSNINAITIGVDTEVQISAYLYDNNQILIPWDTLDATIKYDWYAAPESLHINVSDEEEQNKPICTLSVDKDKLTINEIYILKATVSGVGDVDLVAYFPIALRMSRDYKYVSGPTVITYTPGGELYYTHAPYVMHTGEVALYKTWQLYYQGLDEGEKIYLPDIKTQGDYSYLQPSTMYFETTTKIAVQFKNEEEQIVWTQPVIILQNNYASGLLNAWNGKGVSIDEEQGTILSKLVGAGKKNEDNSFNGILMGDWKPVGDTGNHETGLYGFDHGAISYAFKDDGTAFIGKSGKGRINFDGNKGTISSSSYEASQKADVQNKTSGMLIDLDDGFIDIYGEHAEYKKVTISDKDSFIKNSPLYIKNNNTFVLVNEYESGKTYYQKYVDYTVTYTQFNVDTDSYEANKAKLYYLTDEGKYELVNDKAFDDSIEYFIRNDQKEKDVRPHVKIQALQNPYFHIEVPYTNIEDTNITQELKDLIYIGDNKYYLQSVNYNKGTNDNPGNGMKISLPDGHIDAYNFKLTSYNVNIASGEDAPAYFEIKSNPTENQNSETKEKIRVPLIHASDDNWYLQSINYKTSGGTEGMKIDLTEGVIDSYSFKLTSKHLKIDSTESPYLQIYGYDTVDGEEEKYVLLSVDDDNYFIQSLNYDQSNGIQGMKIDLDAGRIDAYNFKLSSKNVFINSTEDSSHYFKIMVDESDLEEEDKTNGYQDTLMFVGSKNFYLQSINYQDDSSGMKIDLNKGRIYAYNFYLKSNNVIIDSRDDSENYFKIISNEYTYKDDDGNSVTIGPETLLLIGNNNYYLQSIDYIKDASGMKIDLSKGRIDAYNFKLDSKNVFINSTDDTNAYFIVRDSDKRKLLYIGAPDTENDNMSYYLQTADFSNTNQEGIRIDLGNNKITAYNFYLKSNNVIIDSRDDSENYFKIISTNNAYIDDDGNDVPIRNETLMLVGKNNFYLQSANYNTTSNEEDGMKIDLGQGRIYAYNFYLKSNKVIIDSRNDATTYFQVKGTNESDTETLLYVGKNNFYLQSLNYATSLGEEGMYIDLYDGSIDAYNFSLISQRIILNSTEEPYLVVYGDDSKDYPLLYVGNSDFYLQSLDYAQDTNNPKTNGMHINLNTGKITAYEFELESNNIIMNSGTDATTYFQIKSGDNILMTAGATDYYLQSLSTGTDAAQGAANMIIDLNNGSISGSNFSLSGSAGNSSITINSAPSFNVTIADQTVMDIDSDSFVLRSADWQQSTSQGSTTSSYTYKVSGGGIGVSVWSSSSGGSKTGAIPDGWKVTTTSQAVLGSSGRMWYTSTNCPNVPSSGWITKNAQWYVALSSTTTSTSVTTGKGTQIDLTAGSIMMFNSTGASTSSEKLLIDSHASDYPLTIGDFKVFWNGNIEQLTILDGVTITDGGLVVEGGDVVLANLEVNNAITSTAGESTFAEIKITGDLTVEGDTHGVYAVFG